MVIKSKNILCCRGGCYECHSGKARNIELHKKLISNCIGITLFLCSNAANADPTWASNLLPKLKVPTANEACGSSFHQFALINNWIAKYGSAHARGWDYTNYVGDDTKGTCIATYWYPQSAPPGPPVTGDTMVFANAFRSDCDIPGLTPLTDPIAIDFEDGNRWRPDGLTADYQSKLKCVQDGITTRGGSSAGTSAYRPTQYQRHLSEIIQKDALLDADTMTAHPECQGLRDEITRAMGAPPGHGLQHNQLVAEPGTSRHESGMAFDVTPSGLTDAQLTLVYTGCGVTHTAVSGEPWHVQ
jgi:hypothetical protein